MKTFKMAISICFIMFFSCYRNSKNQVIIQNNSDSIFVKVDSLYNYPEHRGYEPVAGFIPDELTASKIAEIVLIGIYGKDEIYNQRPYNVMLRDSNTWCIEGFLPSDMDGGVFYIEINKMNGEILKVLHGR